MTQSEIEHFLLGLEGAEVRIDEKRNLKIYEINFEKLINFWQKKLDKGDLGDFEERTGLNVLARVEQQGTEPAIFAIIHNDSSPLQVEMKTGSHLVKLLRERNESVVPSKLMSEREWNMVIGFGQVQPSEVIDLLRLSYRLVSER